MQNYIIATSSTADLPRAYLEAHQIPFLSYTYTIGAALYEDDCEDETRSAVYKGMRSGDRLKTSMINEFVYYVFFKSLMETGKDVIYLDMSQKMSVSFVNANKAADTIRQEYPDRQLYVMDTLCISGGLGLLVENMVQRMRLLPFSLAHMVAYRCGVMCGGVACAAALSAGEDAHNTQEPYNVQPRHFAVSCAAEPAAERSACI